MKGAVEKIERFSKRFVWDATAFEAENGFKNYVQVTEYRNQFQFLFSPLYSVLTCPNSSVVRREELLVLVVLNLKRAGTTFAAESLASNVITHAATIIKPAMGCLK